MGVTFVPLRLIPVLGRTFVFLIAFRGRFANRVTWQRGCFHKGKLMTIENYLRFGNA
jgi:hypothetical protein